MPTFHEIAIKLSSEGLDYGITNGYADGCEDNEEFRLIVERIKPDLERLTAMISGCETNDCGCPDRDTDEEE